MHHFPLIVHSMLKVFWACCLFLKLDIFVELVTLRFIYNPYAVRSQGYACIWVWSPCLIWSFRSWVIQIYAVTVLVCDMVALWYACNMYTRYGSFICWWPLIFFIIFFISPWQEGVRNVQVPCRYPAGALARVRNGAGIDPLSLRLSVSESASLGDLMFAPACPIEKVTLWVGFLYFSGSKADKGIAKDKVFARTGNRTRDSGSKAQYAIH